MTVFAKAVIIGLLTSTGASASVQCTTRFVGKFGGGGMVVTSREATERAARDANARYCVSAGWDIPTCQHQAYVSLLTTFCSKLRGAK
jgi:hypothetical protein